MPRLYLSPTDLSNYTVALTFAYYITKLGNMPGALDRLLANASRRVDAFCSKRIGAPPTTTVGTGGIAQGATSLPVASTLGFDNGQEQAVLINPGGGTQEIIPLAPGGVQVANWTAPYAGTLTLAQGAVYSHSAGETVQGCYQEVSTVGNSSSSDVYSESLLQMNQAAQIAQAHAPHMDTSELTRVIFLKQYPIKALLLLEHMLPIETTYSELDASNVGIQPAAGYIRLPIGSFVLPEGLFRTTYTAGFASVPEEAMDATAWYAADELQTIKSEGAYDMQRGKVKARYAQPQEAKSRYELKAEALLLSSGLKRTV